MNAVLRAATDDPGVRRALLCEYIGSKIAPHLDDPNVFVVRYERWFADRATLMNEIGSFLEVELGTGDPVVRSPSASNDDRDVRGLVERHCPSALGLGYGR